MGLVYLGKKVATFEAELGSEEDLLGVVPVFISELCLEGHVWLNYIAFFIRF